MNIHSELHRKLSHSFLRYGIIILAVVGGIFFYKDHNGYNDVAKVRTIKNCRVTTSSTKEPFMTKNTYYLSIYTHDEVPTDTEEADGEKNDDKTMLSVWDLSNEEPIFQCTTSQAHFKHFVNYDAEEITIFKSEDGKEFPVYAANADEAEAEREFRHIKPPYGWYALYIIGGVLGIICLYNSIRLAKVAANYRNENYEFSPDPMCTAGERGAFAMMDLARQRSADKTSNADLLTSFLSKDANDFKWPD